MSDTDSVWPHGVPEVGARASLSRRVEPDDIERFTAISGDRNPLHYDADAAAASKFGEIIVQDWQGAGLLKPSAIKPVITTIEKPLVIKTMGRLKDNDQRALQEGLREILR